MRPPRAGAKGTMDGKSEYRYCDCIDWAENISPIEDVILCMESYTGAEYQGKIFSHCPWCGNKLIVATEPNTR